ncbi:MAG: hypothetical protein JJT81_18530, partial [Rubellimicrobium sp.]|nr:hypothetical protein [Rubellimicrobium sp.]
MRRAVLATGLRIPDRIQIMNANKTAWVSPVLSNSMPVLVIAAVPAVLFVGILLYFTVWAVVFSFTDLELVGRKA